MFILQLLQFIKKTEKQKQNKTKQKSSIRSFRTRFINLQNEPIRLSLNLSYVVLVSLLFYCSVWRCFTSCSSVSIANFELSWYDIQYYPKLLPNNKNLFTNRSFLEVMKMCCNYDIILVHMKTLNNDLVECISTRLTYNSII